MKSHLSRTVVIPGLLVCALMAGFAIVTSVSASTTVTQNTCTGLLQWKFPVCSDNPNCTWSGSAGQCILKNSGGAAGGSGPVSVTAACSNGSPTATIAFQQGTTDTWIDLGTKSNFATGSYSSKNLAHGVNSTVATTGFTPALTLTAGSTYYVRVYDSATQTRTSPVSFTVSGCAASKSGTTATSTAGPVSVDMKLTAKMVMQTSAVANGAPIQYVQTKNRETIDGPILHVPDIHEPIQITWTSQNAVACTETLVFKPYTQDVQLQNTTGVEFSAPQTGGSFSHFPIAVSCIGADGTTVTDKIDVDATNNFNLQIGHIDSISAAGIVSGWSVSTSPVFSPNTTMNVAFYVADKPFAQYSMALSFGDQVGIGQVTANLSGAHGNHGFSFRIPDMYRDGKKHYLGAIDMYPNNSTAVGEQIAKDIPFKLTK